MIRDRLIMQQRELEQKQKEQYVQRNVSLPSLSLITVILGPRRAGKSTFAIHGLEGPFAYANFDDELLVKVKDYDEIITILDALYKNSEVYLFDEIQNLPNWELFVNRLHRSGKKILITGSNAHLLSKELATHLTGRHSSVILFPFSFSERVKIEQQEQTTHEMKNILQEYLFQGGYPEPILKNIDYKDYLTTLFTSIIYKDIVKRFQIRNPQAIENLALFLLSNTAREFSFRTLTQLTKSKSIHTVEKYLDYLEEAFLFFHLKQFSYKVKEQALSKKKIYCIDNGLIVAHAFQISPDWGRLYENAVAIQLKKEALRGICELYFWKNPQQEEVDFVVKKGTAVTELLQVCFLLENQKTKEREIRSLLKASKELRCQKLTVVTSEKDGEETIEWFGIRRKVQFIPLWKWLLERC